MTRNSSKKKLHSYESLLIKAQILPGSPVYKWRRPGQPPRERPLSYSGFREVLTLAWRQCCGLQGLWVRDLDGNYLVFAGREIVSPLFPFPLHPYYLLLSVMKHRIKETPCYQCFLFHCLFIHSLDLTLLVIFVHFFNITSLCSIYQTLPF